MRPFLDKANWFDDSSVIVYITTNIGGKIYNALSLYLLSGWVLDVGNILIPSLDYLGHLFFLFSPGGEVGSQINPSLYLLW